MGLANVAWVAALTLRVAVGPLSNTPVAVVVEAVWNSELAGIDIEQPRVVGAGARLELDLTAQGLGDSAGGVVVESHRARDDRRWCRQLRMLKVRSMSKVEPLTLEVAVTFKVPAS